MATLQLEDYLPTLEETSVTADGRPLSLPLDRIDEDPSQPRHEFDADALSELATSIATRGVLQPVSVRRHPDHADRYMLNFGARRLRASNLAGKTEIPAFIDVLVNNYDQVIENEHREALRPMELALFVKRQLDSGKSQADVARELGKSRAYISYVCALIDAPDWLMGVYREGRCRGLKELYDLRRIHEEHPEAVKRLVAERRELSRGDVDALRGALAVEGDASCQPEPACRAGRVVRQPANPSASAQQRKASRSTTAQAGDRWSVLGEAGGRPVRVMLSALPASADEVYVVEAGADLPKSIKLAELKGLRLLRE